MSKKIFSFMAVVVMMLGFVVSTQAASEYFQYLDNNGDPVSSACYPVVDWNNKLPTGIAPVEGKKEQNSSNAGWEVHIPNYNSNWVDGKRVLGDVLVVWATDKGATNGNTSFVYLVISPAVFGNDGPGSFEVKWQTKENYNTLTVTVNNVTPSPSDDVYYVFLGEGKGNSTISQVWLKGLKSQNIQPIFADIKIGFIGWYLDADGVPRQTSFYWQDLKEGGVIDWDAVSEAYGDWTARGGLQPGELFQSSGTNPIYFSWDEVVGFDRFTDGQVENFYKAYYVDPGYVLPLPECNCDKCTVCGGCETDGCCDCDDCTPCDCCTCGAKDGKHVFDKKTCWWAGKGCEQCQGNEGGQGQPLCDGSGILPNGKKCSQGQQ